jgi:hypothetical protein
MDPNAAGPTNSAALSKWAPLVTTIGIRELKRRYRENLALGRALPTHDLGVPLPLSTGNPLFDAALTEKLAATARMTEPEHVARAWHMVGQASSEERRALADNAQSMLNDWKLLVAVRAWQLDDGEMVRRVLRALPWGWRLAFPTTIVSPGATMFTGWRKTMQFRLVEDPRWDALKALFRELLAQAPGTAILKYRAAIKQSMALLRYRPEGEREIAIHDLCFGEGNRVTGLEPIDTYVNARDAVRSGGAAALVKVLDNSPAELPVTSIMGLFGSAGIKLKGTEDAQIDKLRDHVIRCATAVESLLRLKEWDSWLTETRVATLSAKVTAAADRGIDLPFAKVVKAFLGAPAKTRKLVLRPLLEPMMRQFGARVAAQLPPPGPITFVMPANVIHLMSFLLYAVLASAAPSKLVLVRGKGTTEVDLGLDDVIGHLTDDRGDIEAWLLKTLGGVSTVNQYTYDMRALRKALDTIDPAAPTVLDLPFVDDMDILQSLLPRERVFNLNTAYGAPGEICVSYDYYLKFAFLDEGWSFRSWSRYSDGAASRFAELLEKLESFERLAKAGAA